MHSKTTSAQILHIGLTQCLSLNTYILSKVLSVLTVFINKFFEKKSWDPENLGPNFGKYQCLLLLFIEQTGLVLMGGRCRLRGFFSVVVEVATAETLSLPATFIT